MYLCTQLYTDNYVWKTKQKSKAMLTKVLCQNGKPNGCVCGHDNIIEHLLLTMLVFELSVLGQADS